MSDIKICTDENTATPSDIVICDEEQTPKPQDIKICEDDDRLDPCATVSALSISGDGDCNVGDFYSGSGGTGNYTYSFDSGTIDSSTGEILSITSCGGSGSSRSGIISVDDWCSITDLEVRLPGGTWVRLPGYTDGTPCNIAGDYSLCQKTEGSLRYLYTHSIFNNFTAEACIWINRLLIDPCTGGVYGPSAFYTCCFPAPSHCHTLGRIYADEWQCP